MTDEELNRVEVIGPQGQREMALLDPIDLWKLQTYLRAKLNELPPGVDDDQLAARWRAVRDFRNKKAL